MQRDQALKYNNFDLVRLIAAIQVFFTHAITHLKIEDPTLKFIYHKFLAYFPGVPIFYTVSGFLIYASFDRNKNDIKKFYYNRILRIYPALIICVLFTFVLLILDHPSFLVFDKSIAFWLTSQLTVFQFYTPDALRFWGVGTPNGSLWTISVEIQFYILVPLLYYLFSNRKNWGVVFVCLFIFSIANNIFYNDRSQLIGKLYNLFILKYLYYFLFGVLVYKCWNILHRFFVGRFLLISCIYIFYFIIFGWVLNIDIASYFIASPFGFISNIILAFWTLSLAYSNIGLSDRLLQSNDISYGVYIYHMPVINWMVHRAYTGNIIGFITAFIATLLLAFLSWKLVEKRVLKLKKRAAFKKAAVSI